MALIGGIFAALSRVIGRVANMALGWASVLLFGRVPQSRQTLLTFVTLGSIAWVAAVLGVLVPGLGTFLLAAVPRPSFVPELWVRIAMLVVAIVLPLLIGGATVFLLPKGRRPAGRGLLAQLLRGYPYAAVLAVTLVGLAIVALVRKGRALVKRWEDAHVPVVIKPGGYERVVSDLEKALDTAGLDVSRTRAPRALEIPPKLLGAVGGPGVKGLVPDHLAELKRAGLEVLVYPSDVAILGDKRTLARARAAIATRLTFTDAYLTTSKESEQLEDRLGDLADKPSPSPSDFRPIDETLSSLVVPYDEWETLYRLRLQVENERLIPNSSRPGDPASGTARLTEPDEAAAPPDAVTWAAAAVSVALLALDVGLGLVEVRRERTRRRSA